MQARVSCTHICRQRLPRSKRRRSGFMPVCTTRISTYTPLRSSISSRVMPVVVVAHGLHHLAPGLADALCGCTQVARGPCKGILPSAWTNGHAAVEKTRKCRIIWSRLKRAAAANAGPPCTPHKPAWAHIREPLQRRRARPRPRHDPGSDQHGSI